MRNLLTFAIAVSALAFAQTPAPTQVTWTGWFGDAGCSAGRFSKPTVTPPNPECARKCIQEGATGVFLSEQARAVFKVTGYPSLVDDLGYRVEVTARVDEATKTISVQSVKRISDYEGAACARPSPKKP